MNEDQKKMVRKKVDEYLPQLLSRVERPFGKYAIQYAIEKLKVELTQYPEGDE